MTASARFTLAAILLLLSALVANSPPPATAVTEGPLVLIESIRPAAPTKKAVLRVRGRIANTSDAVLSQPSVQLRLSPLPLNSREEIDDVLSGTSLRSGNPLPATLQTFPIELQPGQQQEFTLAIPVADLGLPADSAGVYAVFVELSGSLGVIGTAGTAFPWFPKDAEFEESGLALVWPLVQRPAVAADDLVVDPTVVTEIAPGGRLQRLVTLGRGQPVNWLLDSAMWQTTTQMADGYDLLVGGTPQPGDSTDDAESFAAQLNQVAQAPSVVLPQFAADDADALQRAAMIPSLIRSATLPGVIKEQLNKGSNAQTVFVAPGGTSNESSLASLVDAGTRVVIMDDTTFPPDPTVSYTPSGITSMTAGGASIDVLLNDTRLAEHLSGPFATAAARSTARQAFLTETAMITLERPAEVRNVVALPSLTWDPPREWLAGVMRDIRSADWIRMVNLQTVLDSTPVPRDRRAYGPAAVERELPQQYMDRVRGLQEELERLSRVVNDPTGFGESFTLALQRASSSLWRTAPSARNLLVETIGAQLAVEREKLRVVSSGTVTLAGESGTLPLTIANDLDRAVTVGLELRTENAIRLQYTPPDPVRVDAQTKKSIEVPVRVVGSQPMSVDVILTDRDGEEFNNSATLELRSTAATQIASVIVGVGGIALAFLVVMNLWRRRAAAREGADDDAR